MFSKLFTLIGETFFVVVVQSMMLGGVAGAVFGGIWGFIDGSSDNFLYGVRMCWALFIITAVMGALLGVATGLVNTIIFSIFTMFYRKTHMLAVTVVLLAITSISASGFVVYTLLHTQDLLDPTALIVPIVMAGVIVGVLVYRYTRSELLQPESVARGRPSIFDLEEISS